MTRTKTGVIGVGTMGQHHVRVYEELQEAELVGVSDTDQGQAEEVASEYSTDVLEMNELIEQVDAVSIAVPTPYHYDIARNCIDNDVDVLVEKPLADSPKRGKQLVELAKNRNVTLQVGHIERYNPVVTTLESIVPELDIVAVEAQRIGPPLERTVGDSAVIDLMIHDIDVILSLLDTDISSIDAAGAADGQYATATMNFDDGTIGTLTASRITQRKQRKLSITAKSCYVTADYIDQSIQIHRRSIPEYVTQNGGVRYRHESVVENPAVNNGEPLKYELASFLEASATGSEPKVSGWDGLRALKIARRIDEKAFGDPQLESAAVGDS